MLQLYLWPVPGSCRGSKILIWNYSIADGNHPSEHGTYLAICTFYAYFWNLTPEGFEYVNDEIIIPEERDFLQSIAWQTYNTY